MRAEEEGRHGARVGVRASPISDTTKGDESLLFLGIQVLFTHSCVRGSRSERVRAMGTRVVCRVRPPSCRAAAPSPVSSRAESSEILVASPAYSPSVSPGGAGAGGSPPPSSSPTQTHAFVFDGVFDGGATDDDVSRACLDPALHDVCVRGINATVMAYGQSGAGKTHTMEGGARGVDGKGLIPRASELFSNPSLSSPLPSPVVNPKTPSTPWHITHPSLAGCRARRGLPRGHDVAERALHRHHGRRRALPRSLPRPAQLERTRKLKHSCARRRVFLSFFIFVREISMTDVVFCLTRTGACPARGVWPRGATELPVGTDDDGVSALRSLRAASGRRAVVRLFLYLYGQLV